MIVKSFERDVFLTRRFAASLFDQRQNFFADVVQADRLWLGAVLEVVVDDFFHVGAEIFPSVALGGEILGGGFGVVAAAIFLCYVEHDFAHYVKFAHGALRQLRVLRQFG